MHKREIMTADGAAPSGSYSQAIEVGDWIFVSGQGPLRPGTGEIAGAGIEQQVEATIANIVAILDAAGASLADVVKVTAHLSDLADFAAYERVYAKHFPEPRPARTTVGSQIGEILVEIDVIAVRGAGGGNA